MLRASQRILAARSLGTRAFSSGMSPRDEKSDKPAFNLDNLLGRLDAINKQAAESRGAAAKRTTAKDAGAGKNQGAKRFGKPQKDSKSAAPKSRAEGKQPFVPKDRRSDTRPPRTQSQSQSQPRSQTRPQSQSRPRPAQPNSDLSSKTASAAFGVGKDSGNAVSGERQATNRSMPKMPLFALRDGEEAADRPSGGFAPRRRAFPPTDRQHRFVPSKRSDDNKPRTPFGTRTAPRGVRRLTRTRQRSEGDGKRAGGRSFDSQSSITPQPIMAAAQAKELIMNKVGTSNNRIEVSEYSIESLAKYLPRTALAYNSTVWRTLQSAEVAQPRFAGQLKNDYLVHSNKDFGHALNSNPSYDLEQKELIAKAASGKITPAQLRKMISA